MKPDLKRSKLEFDISERAVTESATKSIHITSTQALPRLIAARERGALKHMDCKTSKTKRRTYLVNLQPNGEVSYVVSAEYTEQEALREPLSCDTEMAAPTQHEAVSNDENADVG